ncbi:MAG: hypothetical protein DLM50_04180 [Candidatus Meridianibacter frigidus]|nr:MAG: hypothetical protein DLM50_04180 [Candidatus Eremiobacteraeota bacterium]
MSVQTSEFSIPVDGSQMPAYLARPDPASGPHPAVIVLQEIFGVNKEVRRIADLLASAGYTGLAINYYHRTHPQLNEPYDPEGMERGFAAASKVSRETLRADVAAAIAWLDAQDFVKAGRIASWGFCFGGAVAFVTATLPDLAGAICFYGGSIAAPFPNGEPEGLADASQIRASLLLAYGEEDQWITAEQIERTRDALQSAGKNFQIQVYPRVGHAFFRDSSESMDPERPQDTQHAAVVADAWNLVQAFLKKVFA